MFLWIKLTQKLTHSHNYLVFIPYKSAV
jgi:hypothetical protein